MKQAIKAGETGQRDLMKIVHQLRCSVPASVRRISCNRADALNLRRSYEDILKGRGF
jgi:hypothetical protein